MTTVAFTGHRPKDLGTLSSTQFAAALDLLIHGRTDLTFVTGGALGVDTWAADYALAHGIPLILCLPFDRAVMGAFWAPADRTHLDRCFAGAVETHVLSSLPYDRSTGPRIYQQRNEWMVDHADVLFALWTGKAAGGTANCIRYALRIEVPCWNLLQDGAITGRLRPISRA